MEKEKNWFYEHCSTYTLKFFTTVIWGSPLLYTSNVLIDSSSYHRLPPIDLRVTSALSPHYQRYPPRFTFRQTTTKLEWFFSNEQCSAWTLVEEEITSNVVLARRKITVNVKIRRRYVGKSIRTYFVKSSDKP